MNAWQRRPFARILRVRAILFTLMSVVALGGCADPESDTMAVEKDYLPAWNDGPAKQAIVDFVTAAVDRESPGYIQIANRIAVFDNDGCLWVEQPMYTQLAFAMDRLREMAPQHPEWAGTEPFASVLSGDPKRMAVLDQHDLMKVLGATHGGMTEAAFTGSASQWLNTAKHPRFDRPYTELTYLPMVELMDYLRLNRFFVYIVTGGGVSFVRAVSEEIYAVPKSRVVGSRIVWEYVDGQFRRKDEIDHINDGAGKPVGILQLIGRRPAAAFGNSDGDLAMLQYTADGPGPNFCLYVHHDDADREYAYDRDSHVGRLDAGLDVAKERGWTVVSMKDDWNRVFAGDGQK